jgi:uncharacterized protein (TIGR01777 family)
MRLLVTGASGLIGTRVARACFEWGYDIAVLARNPEAGRRSIGVPCRAFSWDAANNASVLNEALQGVDAVLHLAGESLATGAWTRKKKDRIYNSRVAGTRALVEAIRLMPEASRPRVLISASAIGIYGDRGEEKLTETSGSGDPHRDFLANVCLAWEDQVFGQPISGMRTVTMRLGLVLARGGGALETMLPPFRLGIGGRFGSGRQWMSWIHIDDVVAATLLLLARDDIHGPVNLTAPNPATNREFTRSLAHAVRRSAVFPVPAPALKLIFGEKASMLLAGQRVLPAQLQAAGFRFRYEGLEDAFGDLCDANRFESVQWIPRPVDEAFAFFSDEKNLERITPPWLSLRVLGKSTAEIRSGTLIKYRLKLHGAPLEWHSLIDRWEPGKMFRDVQAKGPYSRWAHEHHFVPVAGGTLIKDSVRYGLPLGVLSEMVAGHWVSRDIRAIFEYRKQAIEALFGQ